MTIIPDKYIRQACIAAINAQLSGNYISCPIFETEVPMNVIPIPSPRIILSSQTLNQENTTKCGHDWSSTIIIEVINEQQRGYSNKAIVEDILQLVNNAIDVSPGDLNISPFVVYNTQVLGVTDMGYESPTKTINRKSVRYQFILGNQG